MNNSEIIKEGITLFQEIDHRETHSSQPYSLTDVEGTRQVINSLKNLSNKISEVADPSSLEEVFVKELKSQCIGGVMILEEELSPRIAEPNEVISHYNIKKEDIDKVKDWLLSNKENVINANRNQYDKYSSMKKSVVPLGDPQLRIRAEELLLEYIEKIKRALFGYPTLTEHFKKLFNTYHISIDSVTKRSHANRTGRLALLGTAHFTYMSDGKIGVDLPQLISVFGHEVLGHTANYLRTDTSDLPFYIKWGFGSLTSATKESVADFFEKQVFSYIKESLKANELFTGNDVFEDVYTRFADTHYLSEYSKNIGHLGIWVLSQTKMNDTSKQIEEISNYSIEAKWPSQFINGHRNEWNRATELLLPKVVSELKYTIDVVNDIKSAGIYNKPDFDTRILEGMWSPQGVTDYMKVKSKDD